MKFQKRINYYHNRHRSDGVLIENQRQRMENQEELKLLSDKDESNSINSKNKRNKKNYNNSINLNKENSNNKYKKDSNLTEENLRNDSIKYASDNNNSFYHILSNDENYLNIEYSQASNDLTKKLSIFYKSLAKPLPKLPKKDNRNREKIDKQLEEENLLLTKENIQLEKEINLLKKNLNFYNDINYFNYETPSQNEIEQLFNKNQNLIRENEYYRQAIHKIKINKENEKMINNSLKYKADFLVQNMVGSMKELIHLFENDINVNTNMNTNLSIDNKSYTLNSFIPTDNLENFTQTSFSQEDNQSKEQYSEFNSDLNNNINYNYNDNSRNYKDREINFHSKY